MYDGVNSMGEPLSIEVIRFHDYGEIPAPPEGPEGPSDGEPSDDDLPPAAGTLGGRHGLVWATLATELGAANVIGLYIAAAPSVAARGGSGGGGVEPPVHGIMPLIDHDVLFADIAAGDPDDPNDDFTFGMMAEGGSGIGGPGHPLICMHCGSSKIVYCPGDDPQVRLAIVTLDNCISEAISRLTTAAFWIGAAHIAAMTFCLFSTGPAALLCLRGATVAMGLLFGRVMHEFINAVRACMNAHRARMSMLAAAACNPTPPVAP
jgi:hypothetical protein